MQDYSLGIDIGSTTIKFALKNGKDIIYECYERHLANIKQKLLEKLSEIQKLVGDEKIKIAFSGSSGLGISQKLALPFVQEVYAMSKFVKENSQKVNCVIELGGEDAKVIFFDKGSTDERMNGSCAGGTGAFIDQMATLLNITNKELDELSSKSERIYPIASRCGVFAKSDIQPLLNQGAKKEDVSASIFYSIVNQTIAGLAQGRKIEGRVMFLGGPLTFFSGLRKAFIQTLNLKEEDAIFPENSLTAVAIGASIYAMTQNDAFYLSDIIDALNKVKTEKNIENSMSPLFESEAEYEIFKQRHSKAYVSSIDYTGYNGKAYLGIDCGSTTTKLILISKDNEILYSSYQSNMGNPVDVIKSELLKIYNLCGKNIEICGSVVTGYGEELIKKAFHIDSGVVETLAHYNSAKYFNPKVDYILDIGGQDIKCFKIKNGAIDSISLNEACSSGCGSFIETFAKSLGYKIEDFASLALYAKNPVDLGSRCTVFMNSKVKQAQKDGYTPNDISAGLSYSVVKNAIYKVIREPDITKLGDNIVVQGGTFLNDAVLRAFEKETGKNVIRSNIAGLMGAFGCALYAKQFEKSSIITLKELQNFSHKSIMVKCNGCENHCNLTINTFGNGEKYVSGNRCEKGAGIVPSSDTKKLPNLYEYKRDILLNLTKTKIDANKKTIGLPLALGMYEFAVYYKTLFEELGFNVVISPFTTKDIYSKGQFSIPSDTICYPAKVMHGHIMHLLEQKVDAIFYPSSTYNIDEKTGDNYYNCPVVAYYGEVLKANIDELKNTLFMYPYIDINRPKVMANALKKELSPLKNIHKHKILKAQEKAMFEYKEWQKDIRIKGQQALAFAKENGKTALILSGRPYHIDPEICHGIDKLATSLGFVVLSEDSVANLSTSNGLKVLNQWTFHARMYNSATFAVENDGVELVQLVSFGCGIDAITSDEIRTILESKMKPYTQLKIDEITNLGAVKIRLRSLKGILDEKTKLQRNWWCAIWWKWWCSIHQRKYKNT